MLELLFALGKICCLLGLAYGAVRSIGHGETFTTLRRTGSTNQVRQAPRLRDIGDCDPHGSELGYRP
jgi:hypothetical protein